MYRKMRFLLLFFIFIYNLTACNSDIDKQKKSDENVITFTVAYQYQYFIDAVEQFNKSHTNVKLKLKTFNLTFNSSVKTGTGKVEQNKDDSKRVDLAYDEYVKLINSGLMSGSGFDIIKMSGLDYKKYIDKNMLVDFDKLISNDKDFNYGDLNKRVIDLLKYKDKLCVLPLSFNVYPIVVADADIFNKLNINIDNQSWTLNDYYSVVQKISNAKKANSIDKYPLCTMEPFDFFSDLIFSKYDYFVDYKNKKAYFDKKEFLELLKISKELCSSEYMDPAVNGYQSLSERQDVAAMTHTILDSPYCISMCKKSTDKFLLLASPALNGTDYKVSCTSSNCYAINKNSKYINEAWEFIKLLLSEEMQSSKEFLMLGGFPINNTALTKMYDSYLNQTDYASGTVIEKSDIDLMKNYISSINNYSYSNNEISLIIKDDVNDYFSGKKTEQDVVQIIQRKVTTYLNEQ